MSASEKLESEKSFNDDELADIMNEIEVLESESVSGSKDSAASVVNIVEDSSDFEGHDLTAETIKEADAQNERLAQKNKLQDVIDSELVHAEKTQKSASNSPSPSIKLSVEGRVELLLSFKDTNKIVSISADENCLYLTLPGGAKLSLPV